jgi:hypothetical protein
MQEYAVLPGCYIDRNQKYCTSWLQQYVSHSTRLEDGTTIYCFSKELLAYLETLMAFSQYYRAEDPRLGFAGDIDEHYKSALEDYQDITYDVLYVYLSDPCNTLEYRPRRRPRAGLDMKLRY